MDADDVYKAMEKALAEKHSVGAEFTFQVRPEDLRPLLQNLGKYVQDRHVDVLNLAWNGLNIRVRVSFAGE
jgi:hypothetical protein